MKNIKVTLYNNKSFTSENVDEVKILEDENNATIIDVQFPEEYIDYSKRVDFLNMRNEQWTIPLYAPEDERNSYEENFDKLNFRFTIPSAMAKRGELQIQFIAYLADESETFVPFQVLIATINKSIVYATKHGKPNPDLILQAYEYSNMALEISRESFDKIENAERAALSAETSAKNAETSANAAQISATSAQASATSANTRAANAEASAESAKESADYAEQVSNEANLKSDNAVATANTANTNSINAVNTANAANTKSTNAVEVANAANTKSDNAVVVANTANAKSDTAVTTSNEALETAEEALNQVVEKMGTKIFVGDLETPESNMNFDTDPQTQLNNIKNNQTIIANSNGGFSCGTGATNTNGMTFKGFTICDENGKIPVARLFDAIYPVGSIYISTVNTNPGSLFGGTWEAYAQGRTLIGNGTSDQTFTAGATGGSSNHTLTESQIPTHKHSNTISVSASQSSHRHRLLTYTGHTRQGMSNTYSPCSNSSDLGNYWCVAGTGADSFVNNGSTTQQDGTTYASGYSDCAKNGSKGTNTRPIVEASTPSITVSHSITNADTGGGSSHNNLQPYIVTYIWRRTA